jgi:hypothetical protein
MSTGRDGTIIVVQTQGVTLEDDRRKKILKVERLFNDEIMGSSLKRDKEG